MKSCGLNELKTPHLAPPFPHLFPSGSLHFSIVTGSLPHGSGQLELHLRHEDLTALSGQCGTSQVLVPASKMSLERKCSRSLAPQQRRLPLTAPTLWEAAVARAQEKWAASAKGYYSTGTMALSMKTDMNPPTGTEAHLHHESYHKKSLHKSRHMKQNHRTKAEIWISKTQTAWLLTQV